MGVDPIDFYPFLGDYAGQIDMVKWNNGAEFADAMLNRIIEPGMHAVDLLDTWPYLTRMYTTISPAEMTADPFFWANPDLPGVDFTNAIASRRVLCNGDALWTLPDGREVYVPADGPWPDFSSEMPYEEEVAETPQAGAPILLVDNTAAIDAQLAVHNCQFDWPDPGTCASLPDPDSGSGSDGGSSGAADGGDGKGCGCRGGGPEAALGLLVLFAVRLRPRRRRVR